MAGIRRVSLRWVLCLAAVALAAIGLWGAPAMVYGAPPAGSADEVTVPVDGHGMTPTPVPEPASLLLVGAGLAGRLALGRRR